MNMPYCRFRNTLNDLRDCEDFIDDNKLSNEEHKARINLIKSGNIIVDSKSGTSGAGRGANVPTLFSEVYDSFRPYNIGKHIILRKLNKKFPLFPKRT